LDLPLVGLEDYPGAKLEGGPDAGEERLQLRKADLQGIKVGKQMENVDLSLDPEGGPLDPARRAEDRMGVRPALARARCRRLRRRCGRSSVSALRACQDLGDVLVLCADHGDGLPDVDLTVRDHDLEQDAGSLGLHLLRHLVGVELVERLALGDRLALRLQPAHDRPRFHPLPETRQLDLGGHD